MARAKHGSAVYIERLFLFSPVCFIFFFPAHFHFYCHSSAFFLSLSLSLFPLLVAYYSVGIARRLYFVVLII